MDLISTCRFMARPSIELGKALSYLQQDKGKYDPGVVSAIAKIAGFATGEKILGQGWWRCLVGKNRLMKHVFRSTPVG